MPRVNVISRGYVSMRRKPAPVTTNPNVTETVSKESQASPAQTPQTSETQGGSISTMKKKAKFISLKL